MFKYKFCQFGYTDKMLDFSRTPPPPLPPPLDPVFLTCQNIHEAIQRECAHFVQGGCGEASRWGTNHISSLTRCMMMVSLNAMNNPQGNEIVATYGLLTKNMPVSNEGRVS